MSPWKWGAPPSRHVDMFTDLEDLQTSHFRDSLETSSCRHDTSTSFPALPLSPVSREGGWAASSSFSSRLLFLVISLLTQEPTKSSLIRRKDVPIIQEITKVSGTLCQKLGGYIYYYLRIIDLNMKHYTIKLL